MKGTKVDARMAVGAVVLGSLSSGVLGYLLARSRSRREYAARLDEAVAEVKAHYSRPVFPRADEGDVVKLVPNRTKWSDIVRDTVEVKSVRVEGPLEDLPVRDPLEGLDDGSLDLEPAGEDRGGNREGAESEGAGGLPSLEPVDGTVEESEPDGPFVITEAQFGELVDEGFQTISVTYYAADKVLTDDHEQPIRDMIGTVGTLNPLGFGGMSNDPHIRYVRNRRLEVDFEILLDARSYAETILGYGQPNKRREANPAATAD